MKAEKIRISLHIDGRDREILHEMAREIPTDPYPADIHVYHDNAVNGSVFRIDVNSKPNYYTIATFLVTKDQMNRWPESRKWFADSYALGRLKEYYESLK